MARFDSIRHKKCQKNIRKGGSNENQNWQSCFLNIYPMTDKNEEEINDFYNRVDKTLQEEEEYYTIAMGDKNSKTGGEVTGTHGP